MEDKIDGTTTTITNRHEIETVEIKGDKVWDDGSNQDGIRPESITIQLLADGVAVEGKSVVVTGEGDNWSWSFEDLPKNSNVNGEFKEIVYTIQEVIVPEGYTSEITGDAKDGFTVTNTYIPEVISIEGVKTWDDADNQDGIRPESITVRLLANGDEVQSVTVTEAEAWSYKFENLPKFEAGVEIEYTITEDVVEGYSTDYDGYNIINSYTPGETARTVVKVWNDQGNSSNLRPVSIDVQLYADGVAYEDVITLSAMNDWTYTWEHLPEKKAGVLITYTVEELSVVGGYTTTYSEDGFVITNSYIPPEEPTPTPPGGDEPTPPGGDEPTPTPPGNEPTPTPPGEVLGAKRTPEGGAVLGARRGSDFAVLGKRRRPATGDSFALVLWAISLATAVGGAITSTIMLGQNKKKK